MTIKKFTILSLSIVLSTTAALEATSLVEAKAGYFYPTDSEFRDIFSNGGGIYGVELSRDMWCGLHFWVSANYFSKSGSSIGEKDKTRVTLVPLAGGLKYLISCSCVDFYLGGGVVGTYFQTTNDSPFVFGRVSKWGVGGQGKAGILWHICESLFIDFFADYTYMKLSFSNTRGGRLIRHDADVSGISAGGGIGFCF